jgi:hypothetical protein
MANDDHDREQRIRERAYQMWEEAGRPEGRSEEFWERARILTEFEDSPEVGRVPVPKEGPWGEPVEPIIAIENQGEIPTLVDQGEQQAPERPRRRRVAQR